MEKLIAYMRRMESGAICSIRGRNFIFSTSTIGDGKGVYLTTVESTPDEYVKLCRDETTCWETSVRYRDYVQHLRPNTVQAHAVFPSLDVLVRCVSDNSYHIA